MYSIPIDILKENKQIVAISVLIITILSTITPLYSRLPSQKESQKAINSLVELNQNMKFLLLNYVSISDLENMSRELNDDNKYINDLDRKYFDDLRNRKLYEYEQFRNTN